MLNNIDWHNTLRMLRGNVISLVISIVFASVIVLFITIVSLGFQDKQHYLLMLPIGIMVLVLGFAFPQFTLLLLVALVPMDSFAGLLGISKLVTLYKILFPLTLGALLIRRAMRRIHPLSSHPLDSWILAWIILDCLLIVFAHDRIESLDFVRRLISMALLYFVISRLFTDMRWNWRLQNTIVYAAIVSSLFSILLTGGEPTDADLERMAGATDTSPNIFAVSLIPPLLFAITFIFQTHSVLRKISYALMVLILLFGFTLTYSRSAFLVLMIIFFLGFWGWRIKLSSKHWLGLGVGLVIIVLLIPANFWERIASLEQFSSETVTDYSLWRRQNYLKVAAKMFESAPILGVGPGNYMLLHGLAEYQTEPSLMGLARQPHNAYIQVTAETGLVGLVFFLGTLVTALLTARSAFKGDGPSHWQAGALFLAMTAYALMGFFSHLLLDKNFWIILAMIRILPELHKIKTTTQTN